MVSYVLCFHELLKRWRQLAELQKQPLQLTRLAPSAGGATTILHLRDALTVNAYSILLQHKENLDMPYEVMAH